MSNWVKLVGVYIFPFPKDIVRQVVNRFDGVSDVYNSWSDKDPITGREISKKCWNGLHENPDDPYKDTHCSSLQYCKCFCHDYRKVNR